MLGAIMEIVGYGSITNSERYAHPSPESVELAFAKLEVSNQLPARKYVSTEVGISAKTADRQNRYE